MAILQTIKPIIVTLAAGSSYANTYQQYTVKIVGYAIYTGRTWCDSSGNTCIHLENLMRDYVWHWSYVFDSTTQLRTPSCLGSVVEIERTLHQIMTGSVNVKCGNADTTLSITSCWSPAWVDYDPFSEGSANVDAFYNGNVMPHIPQVSTRRYWCGAVFQLNSSAEARYLNFCSSTYIQRNQFYYHSGNVAIAETLTSLFNANPTFPNGKIYIHEHGTGRFPVIGIVDNCPSEFYVSWQLPMGGWFSWGFKGATSRQAQATQDEITDIDGVRKVLAIKSRQTFTLRTDYISDSDRAIVSTLSLALLCYVYDCQKDDGYYCIPDTTLATAAKSAAQQPEILTFNLSKIDDE